MRISISFDPSQDTEQELASVIGRIYATGTRAPVTIHPDDNPETGDDVSFAPVDTSALDKDGLPWDGRIHSTPARMTQKGLWRRRKGVEDATYDAVAAELRAPAAPPVAPAPPAAPAAPMPPAPPAAPPAPPAPPVPAAPKEPTPYESFVAWIADHVAKATSGVTEEWVQQALAAYGVEDGKVVNLQNAAPDFIATIRTAIAGALGVPAI